MHVQVAPLGSWNVLSRLVFIGGAAGIVWGPGRESLRVVLRQRAEAEVVERARAPATPKATPGRMLS